MLIDVYVEGMTGAPVRLRAAMVLVRQDDGTLINVAGEYGGGTLLAHANDKDFNDTLRKLGVHERTTCLVIPRSAVPDGFQLLAAPSGA
jgi:hypothetical protein